MSMPCSCLLPCWMGQLPTHHDPAANHGCSTPSSKHLSPQSHLHCIVSASARCLSSATSLSLYSALPLLCSILIYILFDSTLLCSCILRRVTAHRQNSQTQMPWALPASNLRNLCMAIPRGNPAVAHALCTSGSRGSSSMRMLSNEP